MKRVDHIGTVLWNTLEILLITLMIFVLAVMFLKPTNLQTSIITWLIGLLLAILINRLCLPLKYYHEN